MQVVQSAAWAYQHPASPAPPQCFPAPHPRGPPPGRGGTAPAPPPGWRCAVSASTAPCARHGAAFLQCIAHAAPRAAAAASSAPARRLGQGSREAGRRLGPAQGAACQVLLPCSRPDRFVCCTDGSPTANGTARPFFAPQRCCAGLRPPQGTMPAQAPHTLVTWPRGRRSYTR